MVYYRKYRPQKIEELDLESVRARLESILKQKEIPHAFLFTGPKGLGKTSTARILAKAINCQNKKGIEPCNECDICVSITNGSNLDVLEIDAASNRGIDEIRELRERIKYAPAALSKKVYIIDEVHMLTTDAFNALLKTLEEPPSHAIFILATTEGEKVPPTILSRTFHITFKVPTKKEAISSLERIVAGEKLDVEDGLLQEILDYSEGSFRDASKVMEELVIASDGGKITKELLAKTYNSQGLTNAVYEILVSLSKKDAKAALSKIQELSDQGVDFKILTEKVAEYLHGLIMKRSGLEHKTEDIAEFSLGDLKNLLDAINESYGDIKSSVLPQLPLELVVIAFCLSKTHKSGSMNYEETQEPVRKVKNGKGKPAGDEEVKTEEKKIESTQASREPQQANQKPEYGMFAKDAVPEHFFQALITNIKQDNHSIAGILRGCRLIELKDSTVEFESKYKFHRDKLNEAKTSQILDRRASELLNRKVHVRVEMAAN